MTTLDDHMELEAFRLDVERLEQKVARAVGLAEMGAIQARALGMFEHERRWLDMLHILDDDA